MATYNSAGELVWRIPSAINLHHILQQYPTKEFKPIPDQIYLILDYICDGMEFQDLDENNGYVNLNAHILQGYNKNYEKYLRYLMQCRIIHCDRHFILGKKSRGFAIEENYQSDTVQEIIVQKLTLRKQVKKGISQLNEEKAQTQKGYPYLTKWFNENLCIDITAAKQTIDAIYPELPKPTEGLRGEAKKGRVNKRSKRYKAVRSIDMFSEKAFYCKKDANVGRFHSNLTNIKKELRQHISYGDKKLVNIDIANAQPLLSSLLLQKGFFDINSRFSINNIPTVIKLFKNVHNYKRIIGDVIPYINLLLSQESEDSKGFKQYLQIVQDGSFYAVAFKMMFPNQAFDKKRVKEAVFQTFFSSNRFIGQRKARPKKLFALAYPAVYEVFKRLKRDNHVILSHLLQRIESIIIIEHVCKRIADERPDLPIFSIHDSIATIQGEELYVKEVIKDEIWKLTGLSATINIED